MSPDDDAGNEDPQCVSKDADDHQPQYPMFLWKLGLFPHNEAEDTKCYIIISSIKAADEAKDRYDQEEDSEVFISHGACVCIKYDK